MRKKLPCLLLAGALVVLGLAACDPAGPDQTPSQPVETDAPARPVGSAPPSVALSLPPDPTDPPTAEYDLPDRDYQPWQKAYMGFLIRLRQVETDSPWEPEAYGGLAVDGRGAKVDGNDSVTSVMCIGSECYSLYDVDRDGVPELFVSYGSNRNYTQCYTIRDGQIVCAGEFHTADAGLYTHPEKNAVLCHGGRMGHYWLVEYPMEGGRLTEGREIFYESGVEFSTKTEEIVPGAEYIGHFDTQLGEWDMERYRAPESEGLDDGRPHPSAGKALLLPICDWGVGPAATGDDSEQARAAILNALNGETELYGASGDHFYGDTGPVSWEEYVQPKGAYPSNDRPFEIVSHVWLDMNGDGQEECVLRLLEPEEETCYTYYQTVVLSEQGGTVYAYFFGFFGGEDTFWEDGTVGQYGQHYRLSFWKNQCYEYTARHDPSAQPVEWVDGSPVG